MIQLIYYFPYFNLYLPQFLVLYLKSFSVSKFSLDIDLYNNLVDGIKDNLFNVTGYNLKIHNKKFQDNGNRSVIF